MISALTQTREDEPFYHHFDGMCWPRAGSRLDDLEWTLRYGDPEDVVKARMIAASVVAAYKALVLKTAKDRAYVVRELRAVEEPTRP